MHVCMYVCMYIYTHTCVRIFSTEDAEDAEVQLKKAIGIGIDAKVSTRV